MLKRYNGCWIVLALLLCAMPVFAQQVQDEAPAPNEALISAQMRMAQMEQQIEMMKKEIEILNAKLQKEQVVAQLKKIQGVEENSGPKVVAVSLHPVRKALLKTYKGIYFWATEGETISGLGKVVIEDNGTVKIQMGKRTVTMDYESSSGKSLALDSIVPGSGTISMPSFPPIPSSPTPTPVAGSVVVQGTPSNRSSR